MNFELYNLCKVCFSADKGGISVTKTHGDLVVNSTVYAKKRDFRRREMSCRELEGTGGLSESLRVISQSRRKYRRRVRTGGCIYTAKPNGDTLWVHLWVSVVRP